MMRHIGFIDYYIDEWHANNYPRMIRESRFGDAFSVACAWAEADLDGKLPLASWCQANQVTMASSIEEVVERSDCIVVLSPDNAERHEGLASVPLRSGKPVYVDKPFAPTIEAARRMFETAQAHSTPVMSASALRYGSQLQNALKEMNQDQQVRFAIARGGGKTYHNYIIHVIEMLVASLGTGARRIMQIAPGPSRVTIVDYEDERRGVLSFMPGQPFSISIQYGEDQNCVIDQMTDFFPQFIDSMLEFFGGGVSSVPTAETLEIVAIMQACLESVDQIDKWVDVPA